MSIPDNYTSNYLFGQRVGLLKGSGIRVSQLWIYV